MGYEELVLKYAHNLNRMAFFLIIPLILISLTILLPISERKKRYLEIIGVVLVSITVLISFFFF